MAKGQQARSTRPGRALALMALVLVLTFGGIGLGMAVDKAAGAAPKLGLDPTSPVFLLAVGALAGLAARGAAVPAPGDISELAGRHIIVRGTVLSEPEPQNRTRSADGTMSQISSATRA